MERYSGRVYQYESRFLSGDNPKPHYHIVLADIQIGEGGVEKKGVVIVTTCTPERKIVSAKYGGGEGSFVVTDSSECSFLSPIDCIWAGV